MNLTREPAVAGAFYPESKERLKNDIQSMLDITKTQEKFNNVFGLIVPHAGYIYSGKTAAYAYNLIIGKNYKTVIVISPSHYEYFPGSSIYDGDAYITPLGKIPIDTELREKFVSQNEFVFADKQGHRVDYNHREHALEVQLPFLQMTLSEFKLLPIVIGDQRKKYIEALSDTLSTSINNETLIVVSTDLSHFYTRKKAESMDSLIEIHINNFDDEGLIEDLQNEICSACGGGGVVTLIKTAKKKGIRNSKVLYRTDSGETSGDLTGVVGYLSAVIYSD
jgi:AmmeMemoRadiSam system protein B